MRAGAGCVVTGGSSGIGRACARALARRGARVAVVGRSRERLQETLADLDAIAPAAAGGHMALRLDVSDPDDMRSMAAQVLGAFGRIDTLVASAGLGASDSRQGALPTPTAQLERAEWDHVLGVNLRGSVLSNLAVLPAMQEQGCGTILNVGSALTERGLRGRGFAPAYCASKFSVADYSERLAEELAPDGIRVETILPGAVETPLIAGTALWKPFGGVIHSDHFAECLLRYLEAAQGWRLVAPYIFPMPLGDPQSIGPETDIGSTDMQGERFSGKVAVITGAAGGIGEAVARQLAAEGANIVLVDLDAQRLAGLAGALNAGASGGQAIAAPANVTREADMAAMADAALAAFGRIDILVTAAGILRRGGLKTLADTPLDDWETVIGVNLTGTFLANRAVLPAMLKQGEGDIINISSVSGQQGRAFDGPYSASKFGIIGLSESLAEEVGRQGVRVQTLLPDAVDTALWEQNEGAAIKPRDFLSPAQVADCIAYMVALPRDTFLFNPVIKPLRARRRRAKAEAAE